MTGHGSGCFQGRMLGHRSQPSTTSRQRRHTGRQCVPEQRAWGQVAQHLLEQLVRLSVRVQHLLGSRSRAGDSGRQAPRGPQVDPPQAGLPLLESSVKKSR